MSITLPAWDIKKLAAFQGLPDSQAISNKQLVYITSIHIVNGIVFIYYREYFTYRSFIEWEILHH